jgi:hypothetical protein
MQAAARFADDPKNDIVSHRPDRLAAQTRDALRLLGLSRIPRCAACLRLRALETALLGGTRLAAPWPPAPQRCHHQICAPMVRRFTDLAPGIPGDEKPAG